MEKSIDGFTLKELNEYKGCSRKAADFDEYWERALKELNAVEPDVDLKPASYISEIADCFDMSFTGIDGARLTAKYLRPKKEGKHGCVLCFHGYSAYSIDWASYIPFAAEGLSVIATNCRGQGNDSEGVFRDNTHWNMFGHVMRGIRGNDDDLAFRAHFLDTVQAARIAEKLPEVDPTKIGTYGSSQGGALSIVCSALYGKINRTVSACPFMSDFEHAVECREIYTFECGVSYAELREYFTRFDQEHKTYDDVMRKLSYLDVVNFAPKVKNEALMGLSMQDPICPPASHFAVYNNLGGKKRRHVYFDLGHDEGYGFQDDTVQFLKGM